MDPHPADTKRSTEVPNIVLDGERMNPHRYANPKHVYEAIQLARKRNTTEERYCANS